MEEKKLTDEEIVKALDICYNSTCCTNECPYFNKNGRNFCMEGKAFYKNLEDLINRQKAEIERLKGFLQTFKTVIKEKDEQIEQRLEEVYADFMKEYKIAKQDLKESLEREVELQKQVDEAYQQGFSDGNAYETKMDELALKYEQAVKDTAKEIYKEIGKGDILVVQTQEYGEIEVVSMERLKEIVKSKGVEVE